MKQCLKNTYYKKLVRVQKNMLILAVMIALEMACVGCKNKDFSANGIKESMSEAIETKTEEESVTQIASEDAPKEIAHTLNKETLAQLEEYLEGDAVSQWIAEELCYDWSDWFADYSGEEFQRIPRTESDIYSPAICPDIVFYEPVENAEPETIIVQMIENMITPLTEPSKERPFTIIEYDIREQKLFPLADGLWFLPYIDGYYRYEGTDVMTMEAYINAEPEAEQNGMMLFMKQGSSDGFAYVLLKEGSVYRLQRLHNMMEE